MADTQQGVRHQSARDTAGTTDTYDGDLRALFEAVATVPPGSTFNESFMLWLQSVTGSSSDNINDLAALHASQQDDTYNWSSGGPLFDPLDFVSTWTTDNLGSSADDQITLPLVSSGSYNFTVNWGDGSADDTITAFDDPAVTHTFLGGPGTFTVTISGEINGWQFANSGDRLKFIDVSNWGAFSPGSGSTVTFSQFFGCSNLDVTDTNSMNTDGMTNMNSMFRNCTSLTTLNVSGFNTLSVSDMASMFRVCSALTALDVTNFNTGSVLNMSSMFDSCSSITSLDVSNFNVSNVSNMNGMFAGMATVVTLDLFSGTFNSPNMGNMFSGCFDVTALDVSGFDTAGVADMSIMFNDCSSITSLDVSGFDTSGVSNMSLMFLNCSGLTSLALDQAGWDIGLVTNLSSFLGGVTLNTANYDAILAAWAAQSPVQSTVTCSFGNSVYTIATAQADRDILTNAPNSWVLTDGGGI